MYLLPSIYTSVSRASESQIPPSLFWRFCTLHALEDFYCPTAKESLFVFVASCLQPPKWTLFLPALFSIPWEPWRFIWNKTEVEVSSVNIKHPVSFYSDIFRNLFHKYINVYRAYVCFKTQTDGNWNKHKYLMMKENFFSFFNPPQFKFVSVGV